MSRPEILTTRPMSPLLEPLLDAEFQVHRLHRADDPAALLGEVGSRIRAAVVGAAAGFPDGLWPALPALELIVIHGKGVDRIDSALAAARGVRVAPTGKDMSDDVADLAMALWLGATRRVVEADRYVRAGHWAQGRPLAFAARVSGRPVGILGLGKIGSAIARRAEPFASVVRYHSRRPAEGCAYEYVESLQRLAELSEVLFVAVSGSEQLVGRATLDALGPRGCLVNIARGSVVDEAALDAALAEGRLMAAGLDVFTDEPNVPTGLVGSDAVVLQPHLGSATHEGRAAMAEEVVAALRAHFG